MLDLKFLRKEYQQVATMLKNRCSEIDIASFISLDEERRKALAHIEELKAKKNIVSQTIAQRKRESMPTEELFVQAEELGVQIASLEGEVKTLVQSVEDFVSMLPNMLHSSVPIGKDESENIVERVIGSPREFSFSPKAHWELSCRDGHFDFEKASKLAGSRFSVLWGQFAKLERAIGQFCLDIQIEHHKHIEIAPPFIVNRTTLFGTGQLPKFEDDLFRIEESEYYLIPTAEVPLTNLYANELIEEKNLPLQYVALTPCFRSEAGSYGKDTKGLIRQHQFMKVEMVHFAHPESSYEQLDKMVSFTEYLLSLLELPYRVVSLCSGDTGFSAAKTYDIEVWIPSQNAYREISSCSNCEDFQARRANIRYVSQNGKKQFVHTLNGSGLPLGRTLVALLENYQEEDGSIRIPRVLQSYMGTDLLRA
ncbi:MAG: serine--tRNA ligase [Desulfovibrionaceae bacterium]|nr:serine--tRNA ligase [Desulfovibrionaceae bacterium]